MNADEVRKQYSPPPKPSRPVGVWIIAGLMTIVAIANLSPLWIVPVRGRGMFALIARAGVVLGLAFGLLQLRNWARIIVETICILVMANGVYAILLLAVNPFWRAPGMRQAAWIIALSEAAIAVALAFVWNYLRCPELKKLYKHVPLRDITTITDGSTESRKRTVG